MIKKYIFALAVLVLSSEINDTFAFIESQLTHSSNQEYGTAVTSPTPHIHNLAQSFQTSVGGVLNTFTIKVRDDSSTDSMYITLQTDNSGNPSGTVLGTSNQITGESINNTNSSEYSTITFTFSSAPNISANTKYWIVLERTVYTDWPDNFYYLRSNQTDSLYSNGEQKYNISDNLATWHCIASCINSDIYFIINGIYFSQLQNSSKLNFRDNYGLSSNVIRTLPQDWVVKVLETTDENGNNIESDGYRWYKVEDLTDGEIGYMAAVKLSDGTVYLDYDENAQADLVAQ